MEQHRPSLRPVLVSAICVCAFLTLLTDFVAAIYAFGLLGVSIPPEMAAILFLLAPLLLLSRRRDLTPRTLAALGLVMLLAAALEVSLPTRGRMLISGVGVGAGLVLLPAWLREQARRSAPDDAAALGLGGLLGASAYAAQRVWNSGVAPTEHTWYRVLGWALLAVAAAAVLPALRRVAPDAATEQPRHRARGLRVVALSLGLFAALLLLYFGFSSPYVIARWTGANYLALLALLAVSLAALALWALLTPRSLMALHPTALLLWNAAFGVALVAAIVPHQLPFPADAAGYPYAPAQPGPLTVLPLMAACVLAPVLLVDIAHYARALVELRPRLRGLTAACSLGAFFLLCMVLAQIFTTVYDYIPVIGPIFRDRFWVLFVVLGVVLTVPSLALPRRLRAPQRRPHPLAAGLGVVLSLLVLAGGLSSAAVPQPPPAAPKRLRVLTYNIQQGYDSAGQEAHAAQLEAIRLLNADIIGLQESDTNRISGGNADLVRYLADNLQMHTYYGPTTVVGTFGIALLSRYPIENARTVYMHSVGEQTAAILAQVEVAGRTWNLLVTHLGNGGPLVQQQAVLESLDGLSNVVAVGDYNFRPSTEQYAITRQLLDDAWLLRWPNGADEAGQRVDERIDHVFVSPGTVVHDAHFHALPTSDHPALLVELGW
ncbi:MAG: hypothetical protein GX557_01750 [Chloroflexi bacterium]|nr:hypothetical protein [Chloroflexota bacterium]